MIRYNKLLLSALVLFLLSSEVMSQTSVTNSSYSRFGLGALNEQAQGFNKNMGGVGLGLRSSNIVNTANPASYSAIDSATFIFDVGMSTNFGSIRSNGRALNSTTTNLDYVNAGLRLVKNVGLSFGFMPFTSVGYSFSAPTSIGNDILTNQIISKNTTYDGSGGIHQAYIGVGAEVYKRLSVGANISFLWGDIRNSVTETYSEGGTTNSSYAGLHSLHTAEIATYRIDLGAQYPVRLSTKDWLTIGFTSGFGHAINGKGKLYRYTGNNNDAEALTAKGAYSLPYSYGLGLGWTNKNNLQVGLDFKHELWGSCTTPKHSDKTNNYIVTTGQYKDKIRFTAGATYIPDPYNKHYWKRIRYRVGANYSSPNLVINGSTGPSEYCLTTGLGLPITNRYSSRSVVNIGVQWKRVSPMATSMITENYFCVNIGLTFCDNWFMKYKIQ